MRRMRRLKTRICEDTREMSSPPQSIHYINAEACAILGVVVRVRDQDAQVKSPRVHRPVPLDHHFIRLILCQETQWKSSGQQSSPPRQKYALPAPEPLYQSELELTS